MCLELSATAMVHILGLVIKHTEQTDIVTWYVLWQSLK
jgi:hypothetical protein